MRIEFRDGTEVVTRFKEKNARFCVTYAGKWPWSKVAVFNILRKGKYNRPGKVRKPSQK